MYSRRLGRQIKKCFQSETFVDELGKEQAQTAESLALFLQMVDETYGQLDEKADLAHRSLEVSSKELTDANFKLYHLNQTFDALVNSLGQGFFLFGPDGLCLPVYSKICESLVEVRPAGMLLEEVLRIPAAERPEFIHWYKFIFEERIEFSDMVALGPVRFNHSENKEITLEYKPCRDSSGKLIYVVVTATDRTCEFHARRQAEELNSYVKMVVGILKNKNHFKRLICDVRRMLAELHGLVHQMEFSDEDLNVAKRLLHTIKGAALSFGLSSLKEGAHANETAIGEFFKLTDVQNYLQKAVVAMSEAFETLLVNNKDVIGSLSASNQTREVSSDLLWNFAKKMSEQNVDTKVIQYFVTNILSVPLKTVFAEYNHVLFDVANPQGKKIDPIYFGGEDLSIVEENYRDFISSLVHVFTNIADHGIEPVEERVSLGKSEAGRIEVDFFREKHTLRIEIRDDGRGIDPEKIRAKLIADGHVDWATSASEQELIEKIFDSSFSTANQVTEISGRGVGLDVLRTEVLKLHGTIRVTSKIGHGTAFAIEIPDTDGFKSLNRIAG